MLTIGRLARRAGLARSTLLHYDAIGLLRPSGRAENGYRLYSDDDAQRLERICRLRQTGLGLPEIQRVVDSAETVLGEVLHERLARLDDEIQRLRVQQAFILAMLLHDASGLPDLVRDKTDWMRVLTEAGLDREAMRRWHQEFERLAPEDHERFLRSLHMSGEEIEALRASLRAEAP